MAAARQRRLYALLMLKKVVRPPRMSARARICSAARARFAGRRLPAFHLLRARIFAPRTHCTCTPRNMTDELEKHVLKKYDIVAKLGKGVRTRAAVTTRSGRRPRLSFPRPKRTTPSRAHRGSALRMKGNAV